MKEISKDMALYLFKNFGFGDCNSPYLLLRNGYERQIESERDIE